MKLVILDDSEAVAFGIVAEGEGWDAEISQCPSSAIDHLREGGIDLLVTDDMPEIDGLKVAALLRIHGWHGESFLDRDLRSLTLDRLGIAGFFLKSAENFRSLLRTRCRERADFSDKNDPPRETSPAGTMYSDLEDPGFQRSLPTILRTRLF